MRCEIVAEASAGLLCRIIGLLAQHDFAAPDMQVTVTAGTMVVGIDLRSIPDVLCETLAAKMARCIGVENVTLAR